MMASSASNEKSVEPDGSSSAAIEGVKLKQERHVPVLDHLRALAALLVLAFHLFISFPHIPFFSSAESFALLRQGYVGVSLFLTLSGFLFMWLVLKRGLPGSYLGYIQKRLLRVGPLLVIVYVLAVSINRDGFTPGDLGYLLITNIGKPPTSAQFATGTAWSISLELAFYIIFPLLARFVLEEGLGYLGRLILLCLVFKLAAFGLAESGKLVMYSTLIGRMDQFLWGMAAAVIAFRSGLRVVYWRVGLVFAISSLIVYGVWLERHAPYQSGVNEWAWVLIPTVEGVLFALLIICSFRSELVLWRWFDHSLSWIALISYSLFLLHPLAIELFRALIKRGTIQLTDGVAAAMAAVLAILLAALSYRTIEAPFMRLRLGRSAGSNLQPRG